MKKLFGLPALILISFMAIGSAKAQNQKWQVITSKITFKIKNLGILVDGSFKGLNSDIIFSPDKVNGNSITAKVDVKTINTGNSGRDNHLKKEDYFDANKYSFISLVANLFVKQTDGSYKGYFKLTIKNKTKEVIIPFTFRELKDTGTFSGSFTINRLDYGVGSSSLVMSDNVSVSIEISVKK